jgi:hypothetical protein
MRRLGKKPIRLFKALPGHVANRLQAALYKEVLYLIQQGVLSVEDADAAVSYGPGPRWGVMGPSLQWHLGGGQNGIQHFMEHLMDPLAGLMKVLGTPNVTSELKQTVTEGVMRMAGKVYLAGAITLALGFALLSIRFARNTTNLAARQLPCASIMYLPIILVLLLLDRR